jgi:hypothetical protein
MPRIKNPYLDELGRIMSAPAQTATSTLSLAEIEAAIADISEQLKAPLHNVERLDLVEARRALRHQLATLVQ